MIEASQVKAREEGQRLIDMAQADIEQQVNAARESLIQEVTGLAMQGASKILNAEVNEQTSARLVDEMIKEG